MYICEYKTTNVYETAGFIPKQREYEKNDETSATISFKVGRTKYFYDATRRYNQMGRYMNHSRRPNIRPYPPLFVRGKSRIGMYSINDIKKNEELLWDYGITTGEMPWEKSEIIDDKSNDESNEEKDVITGTLAKSAYKKYIIHPLFRQL